MTKSYCVTYCGSVSLVRETKQNIIQHVVISRFMFPICQNLDFIKRLIDKTKKSLLMIIFRFSIQNHTIEEIMVPTKYPHPPGTPHISLKNESKRPLSYPGLAKDKASKEG